MNMKHFFAFLAMCCWSLTVVAQNDEDMRIYNQAEADYSIGRVEQAEQQLKAHLGNFYGDMRQNVYRLLSLCALEQGNDEEARRYVQLIVGENPFFRADGNDPQRFKQMLADENHTTATISTASSKDEALSEVPVPVTLITADMIRDCCARNLKEVLAAYVPSMNNVDCNDDINIAMRGIFSNGQEMILILLNGHRLNSYCSNIASPDFSISLEKVKQIEVLRGPASSLYGGVALTAVVNIITKQGGDVDGLEAKAGIGNFGQLRGDMLFGKHYADIDFLLWGSLYKSDGQHFQVAAENTGLKKYGGEITVGGVGEKPSYDLGLSLAWKNRLKFLYDTHFSQVISPFTASYGFSPYERSAYMTFNGIRPSYATRSHHLDLSYARSLVDDVLNLQASITYDNNDMTHYQVVSDSSLTNASNLLGIPSMLDTFFSMYKGIFRYINGQESNIGAQVKGDVSYNNRNEDLEGLLTFGAQFNHFELDDVRYVLGLDYNNTILETNDIAQMGKGSENNVSAFLQLKQRFYDFILNAGIRYDHRRHYDHHSVNELSPRLALIYVRPKWNVKLSYSKSFVDAPYFYRKTNTYLGQLSGGGMVASPLESEYMHSLQLTLAGTRWMEGLDVELNGFYNRATDLIYTSLLTHENAGTIKTVGAELTGSYRRGPLMANLSCAWQHVLKSEIYNRHINKAYNIPNLTLNAVLGWNVTNRLRLHGHVLVESKQTNYMVDLLNQQLLENTIHPRAIVDMGARYQWGRVEFGMNCRNLLNKQYMRGGIGSGAIPQQGRSWMVYAAVKI